MDRLLEPIVILAAVSLPALAHAHPVPKSNHDRTIIVRLQPGTRPDEIVAHVDYRLEVDPATVVLEDMKPFQDQIDITQFKNRADYFKEFTRLYAPILADRLIAEQNGVTVEFVCLARSHTLRDEKGQPLDHLRCDFVFSAALPCFKDKENRFVFREGNFQEQEGLINLSLSDETKLAAPILAAAIAGLAGSLPGQGRLLAAAAAWPGRSVRISIISKIEPDSAVKNRSAAERLPGDDPKLRLIQVRFTLSSQPAVDVAAALPGTPPSAARAHEEQESGLLRLFIQSEYGFWLLLVIAAYIGAMHALTPGHGKTLMAAYLVGEHGTLWHAVLLGLVTAITHTGVVLLIALGLLFLPANVSGDARRSIQTGLGLVMGLAIVCLGFYLFLSRLSGRADHIHLGGGHHHHHSTPSRVDVRVSTWGLILLGMSGGLIPCTDAIAMLVLAVGMNLFWLAFPLLVAFSAGLAGVLVLVGILVVKFRNFAGSHWGEGRLVRALPIISAVLVTAMGFWLCYEAVQGPP